MKPATDKKLFGSKLIAVATVVAVACAAGAAARDITYDEAIDIAVSKSGRGEMIEGDLEVAEQNYFAERINFYIPEISLHGNVPVYDVTESFRFFGGLDQKQLIKTTSRDYRTYIQLNQSLITGGAVNVTGNIWDSREEYPLSGEEVIEKSRQGIFDFKFEQPLLKPSDPKNKLNNTRDDLEIARLKRVEDIAALKKEVTDAYIGVLQSRLQSDIAADKAESARLKADIDSSKFDDGILSEGDWLLSQSERLDAELDRYDMQNQLLEKHRELALLLDMDVTEDISPAVPDPGEHLAENVKTTLVANWEESVPVRKALYEYSKAKRQASYTASSHGLTGSFEANYTLGRGDVEVDGFSTDNNTDSWGVAVNFTLPLWDGGSTGAAIKAARITAQKSELEYEKTRKSARADIVALVQKVDVSYRKLQVLQKQIEIARNKLDIAQFRLDDGQISRIEYLESKVFYLQAQNDYLEELKNYLNNKIDIESKYIS